MNVQADKLAAALRLLPDEGDMIEHNPDEGMSLYCCGGEVQMVWRGDDRVKHAAGCWHVAARAALAAYEAELMAASSSFVVEPTTAGVHNVVHVPSNTNMGAFAPDKALSECERLNLQDQAQHEACTDQIAHLDRIIARSPNA